eukprot:2708388-Amphidinium_carterae.1
MLWTKTLQLSEAYPCPPSEAKAAWREVACPKCDLRDWTLPEAAFVCATGWGDQSVVACCA